MKPHSFHLWFLSCTILGAAVLSQATPVELGLDPGSTDLLIASPDGYPPANHSFGSLPEGSQALSGNGQGIAIVLQEGEGFLLYGPATDVGHGVAHISCLVRTTGPEVALAVAGLNIPAGGTLADLDDGVALNTPANGHRYTETWGTLELFYDPEGDAVAPVFQAVSLSAAPVTVWIDRIAITPLTEVTPTDLHNILHLNEPSPTSQPTPPPTSTPTPTPTQTPPDGDSMLWVAERLHLFGGDTSIGDAHHTDRVEMSAAWSGESYAVAYHDYIDGYRRIAFTDPSGNLIGEPVSITSEYRVLSVLWTGDRFLCIYSSGEGQIVMRAFSPEGAFLQEQSVDFAGDARVGSPSVSFQDGVILVGSRVSGYSSTAIVARYTTDGEPIGTPLRVPARGDLEDVALVDDGFAVLGYLGYSAARVGVQFFDAQGNPSGPPYDAEHNLGRASIHWNGRHLLLVTTVQNDDQTWSVVTHRIGRDGRPVGEPVVIGSTEAWFVRNTYSHTSDLLWTGSEYLALWNWGAWHTMRNVSARLLDADGYPKSELLRLNSQVLDGVNQTGVFTGDAFTVFTVEQGYRSPSMDTVRLEAAQFEPPFTPTATPNPTEITPTPTDLPLDPAETMTFRAYIDGIDFLHIRGNEVWYEHDERDKPGRYGGKRYPTVINGNDWQPRWSGNTTRPYTAFDPALPSEERETYRLESLNARGVAVIFQEPSAENDYELVIFLDDSGTGEAAWYEFTLRWTNSVPVPTPVPGPHIIWRGVLSTYRPLMMEIQDNDISLTSGHAWDRVSTLSVGRSGPLADYPVNLTAQVVQGDAVAAVIEQPRSENGYTAKVALTQASQSETAIRHTVIFRWGDEVQADPTHTPVPDWNPQAPTPTLSPQAPSVLWILNKELSVETPEPYRGDWLDFQDIFASLGAENTTIRAGSQPLTEALLSAHTAVVFGAAGGLPPLTNTEQGIVMKYVRGGGSIFVTTRQEGEYELESPAIYATSVTEAFGIRFSTWAWQTATEFVPHALTHNVDRVRLGHRGAKLLVQEPAQAIAFSEILYGEDEPDIVLACADEGYGRVVGFAGEIPFMSTREEKFESSLDRVAHRQLAENIAGWLLHRELQVMATPTPPPVAHIDWKGVIDAPRGSPVMEFRGDTFRFDTDYTSDAFVADSAVFSSPLPAYPVNIEVTVVRGDAEVIIVEQPRAENDYTARIVLRQDWISSGRLAHHLVITWGDELAPDATATPWPTWNPTEPSPTPLADTPKVLWVVKQGALPEVGTSPYFDFLEFAGVFEEMGALNEQVRAGSEVITDDLLSGYQAVIFGDTRTVEPLSESEREAVVRYVRSGGSIFIIGQQDNLTLLEPSAIYATSVGEPFGIQFSTRAVGAYLDSGQHLILTDVSTLDASGSELIVEPPVEAIGLTNTGDVILAVAQDGYGRVVAYSDEMAFFDSESVFEGLGTQSHMRFARNIAAWLLRLEETYIIPLIQAQTPTPTATPTFVPSGTDEEAQALVDRMLDANYPWTNPGSITATYSIERVDDGDTSLVGDFSVSGGGANADRVGSVVWTALHNMEFASPSPAYTARMVGHTTYNDLPVIAVDIVFKANVFDKIGLGGQETGSYYAQVPFRACRIFIEPERAIPLHIKCSVEPELDDLENAPFTWSFEPDFYEVDGGYAPRVLERDEPTAFRERQTFQVVDGVWIFETGDAFRGEETGFGEPGEYILTYNLTNLVITEAE